jgi:eukaryotic-like serine/threonine-protein kinase
MGEEKISEERDTQDAPSRRAESVAQSGVASHPHTHVLSSGFGPDTPSSLQQNQILAGRYELLSLLGSGGMGTVYRARDRELDEEVALKVLRRELVDAPGMLDRFRREVKLARRVTHRNVARAYDIGEHGEEKFLTMEYIDGEPLSLLVARQGRLTSARVIEIVRAVCDGLSTAHAAGVLHRDLKPDNIMISRDGRAVITDFGIARALADGGGRTIGVAVGTPAYMAPEQVEGSAQIDERADVYALGVILYELFVGQQPWRGESVYAVAAARLAQPPPDPRAERPSLCEQLAVLIQRAMARQPSTRFASARALSDALGLLPVDNVQSKEPTPPPMAPPTMAVKTGREGKALAVLPFRSAGAEDDEYLADGLTEDLIDLLSMTPGLRVRPRGAVIHLKGKGGDVRELGRELGVQVVVEGSVRKAGDAVRINTRLISVHDGFQLWARRFDRKARDVLSVSDEVAQAIAEALTVEAQLLARAAPTDPAALDAYFRGRFEYHKYERSALERALELFEQARALAPDDPMILTGAALARARLWFFGVAGAASQARECAERALALAPGRAEPHLALGAIRFQEGNCVDAAVEAKRALSLQANLPDAHDLLGKLLTEAGPGDRGIEHFDRAAALDPAFADTRASSARVHALLGRWELAHEMLTGILRERDSFGAFLSLARLLHWRRDAAGARALLSDPRLALPRFEPALSVLRFVADPEHAAEPGELFYQRLVSPHASWRSRALAGQTRTESALSRGLHDEAMSHLEETVASGLIDLVWVDGCPLLDPLRGTERFAAQRGLVEQRARSIRIAAG